jgi:peptidoglycan/xylan/chitin deacetylase (PgdA/CDA1 family)
MELQSRDRPVGAANPADEMTSIANTTVPEDLVSVVIPTRDRWSLLATTLETVIRQESVALEVVIVDDGSAVPMPAHGQPWDDPRVRTVRHDSAQGVATARNRGIRESRGDWVAFLDDDDLWAPGKLRAQLAAAHAEGAGFAYAGAVLFREDTREVAWALPTEPARLPESLRSLNAIPAGASNVIARADLLERVGGFDTRLAHLADWDMWIRLARAAPAAACMEPLVGYRMRATSMRSVSGGVLSELRALDRKHHGGSVRSASRFEVYRWLADGQLLAGRRAAATGTRARGALHCRSPKELVRAPGPLLTHSGHGRSRAPWQAASSMPRDTLAWLERYAGSLTSDDGAPAGSSRRIVDRLPSSFIRSLHRPVAEVLERSLRMTELRAGVALVYHEIVEAPSRRTENEIVPTIPVGLFEAQVALLARRYRVVTASELPRAVAERRRWEPFPIAVTFDDDLRSHVTVALPVLLARGVKATFFLTGASLHAPASFWWERLRRAVDAGIPLPVAGTPQAAAATLQAMEAAERDVASDELLQRLGGEPADTGLRTDHVRTLADRGFELGFHTREHPALPTLDDAALARAFSVGRQDLEAAAQAPVGVVAYPHGEADVRVARAASEAGYAIGFTTAPRAVVPATDPMLIGRLYPSQASVDHFAMQLARALWRARVHA